MSYAPRRVSNIPVGQELDNNNHEEADTLLVLHSLDVAQQDPFQKPEVVSPDTDVFLLLTFNLPEKIKFVTGRLWLGEIDGVYIAVMTDRLPAPVASVAVFEMSVCKCNSGCANQRCKCRKNKLVCTEMC